jgi:hypothetical protein
MIDAYETTSLWENVKEITSGETSAFKYSFEVIIHSVEHEIVLDAENIIKINIKRDFNENYTDEMFIEFNMLEGDYVSHIYPHRNNLEITITKKIGSFEYTERYKFVLVNDSTLTNFARSTSMQELNKQSFKIVMGQCLSREFEILRTAVIKPVIYRKTTLLDALHVMFNEVLNEISIAEGKVKYNLNFIKPDNNRTYEHIIIQAGKKLIHIPKFLQNGDYGIYNGGLGLYFQRLPIDTYFDRKDLNGGTYDYTFNCFIYPLYDSTFVGVSKHKLLLYGVTNDKYNGIDTTYNVDSNDIHVVVNGSSKIINNNDSKLMTDGVGYTYFDPNRVLKDDNITVSETDIFNNVNSNMTAIYHTDRSDGVIYRPHVDPEDNGYKIRKNVLKQRMNLMQVTWDNSNDIYLLPGMATIYYFLDENNETVSVNGVLNSYATTYDVGSKKSSTLLNIMIDKDTYSKD